MAKLGEYCEVNPSKVTLSDDALVSFVPMTAVSEDGIIDVSSTRKYADVKTGFTCFQNGDVLFAKITPCMENGKGAIAENLNNGIGFGSTEFHVLRPDPTRLDSKYLYYCTVWPTFRKDCERNMTGSAGQKRVPKKYIETYDVSIPDLPTQRRIAATLDKVSEGIAVCRQMLADLDVMVKARFVEMFGSIHDNHYGYRVCTIQDVCEPIKDGTHQTPTYTEDTISGFKFLSSKDVTTGKIDWDHLKYIPASLHEQLYSRLAPRKGDILLAKNGTTGIAAIVDRDEVFDIYVSLALLRPKGINPVYLCSVINSQETKDQFNGSLKGIGVPNLHLGEIKKTQILVGPKEKQDEFASFVYQADKSKSVVQQQLAELETLKKSLMQEYFG